jgi:hypothetical protein
LYYSKSFRLYARDDQYAFDFIDAPTLTLSWNDTTTAAPPAESPALEPPSNEYIPADTSLTATTNDFLPSWYAPAPQPEVYGPVLRFEKVSLNFVTSYDSTMLNDTKGTLGLFDNIFVGENGSFDWWSAGLPKDSLMCNMTVYNFDVRKPELKADVVKLNYVGKTPGFIPGTFEFKSIARKDSTLSTFPRFKSYQSDLTITGLADENVRYRGGYTLTGKKISSTSATGQPAFIEVYKEGQKKFTARSGEFVFLPGQITSEKTKVNILQGNDSLVHQMVRLKYTYGPDSTQRLLLMKDPGEMRNAPYSSTFFNIDFTTDLLRWDLYTDSLDMQINGARNTVPMIIESTDYYDPEDYRLLTGVGFAFHPLALVVNYALKNRVRQFYSGDLANFSQRNPLEIKQAVEFLREKGLVNYDSRTDVVQLKPKAVDLYKAFKGEEDYDNLKIHSVIDTHPNATINFKDRSMTVRGVREFDVSDSLKVHIEPDSSVITILKNRDIRFDGMISAGNFVINGRGFTLKYDSFFISLNQIDSINFFVTEKNARGQDVRRKINNSMVGADSTAAAAAGVGNLSVSTGTLFISKPNNKSGKVKLPNYPRLNANKGGVIYFDREEVLGGVYDRSIFFVAPPFKLDSLNNADPGALNFDGTFVSSGMFPSFKEKLVTMQDRSLGFYHATPPAGFQLFTGAGVMRGVLSLNSHGLRANGEINYLAATLYSHDFIFYPDSVITKGHRAKIEEKQFGSVLFPQASLPDFQMKWYPKIDKMQLKNLKAPFNFYDSTAQMLGVLTISKEGVAGAGKLDTRGTELVSREMNFTGKGFSARHARFKVKSDDPQKQLLAGNDIRLKFNLEENYADISPEIEGIAAIEFPYAQFKTSIPRARWDLAGQKITMSKAPDVPIENSYFYTTRKDLDSLHFNAEKAEYDLKTQQLKVSGIPYIIVADAMITPENNEVLIHENARIGTLHHTTIVVDTLNGYHRLTEGVVDVISRKEFTGYATYQYVNFLNDTFAIKMTDFHLEPVNQVAGQKKSSRRQSKATMQTVAKGSVKAEENLVLGAGMFYKGDLTMFATRPALQLDGFIKLDIRKIKDYNTWIQYSQSGDETEVTLNYDKALNESGKRVEAGLHFNSADNSIYLTFGNDKKSEDDDDLFVPSGKLYYDNETKEYKIEDMDKTAGSKLSGKVFAYKDETNQARFEGQVNLFPGTKNFKLTSTALGTANLETSEVRMNSFLMVDTDVPPQAIDIMARNIQQVIKNEGAEEGLGDQTELLYKIANIIGERAVKEYESQSVQGYVSLATLPELARPLVFSNVVLKWSPQYKAFYSEGPLGISNMGKNDINGAFEGFMEIRKTEDGSPAFNVFLKASPDAWYYFGMEDNRLLVYSSNKDFNNIISKKSTAGKAKIGEVAFVPGSEDETLAFINRFRKQYLQIEVPYSLYEASAVVEQPQTTPPPATNIEPPATNNSTEPEKKDERKKKGGKKQDAKQEEVQQEVKPQDAKPVDKNTEEPKKEKVEDDGF